MQTANINKFTANSNNLKRSIQGRLPQGEDRWWHQQPVDKLCPNLGSRSSPRWHDFIPATLQLPWPGLVMARACSDDLWCSSYLWHPVAIVGQESPVRSTANVGVKIVNTQAAAQVEINLRYFTRTESARSVESASWNFQQRYAA